MTPEEIAREIMNQIPLCGSSDRQHKLITDQIAAAIRAERERGRLAGWEQAREACKAVADKEANAPRTPTEWNHGWRCSGQFIADAIATLSPPKETT